MSSDITSSQVAHPGAGLRYRFVSTLQFLDIYDKLIKTEVLLQYITLQICSTFTNMSGNCPAVCNIIE